MNAEIHQLAPARLTAGRAEGQSPSDPFRSLQELRSHRYALIEYRPGVSDCECAELSGGPDGPDPVHVARHALRSLKLRPSQLLTDEAEPLNGIAACWLLDLDEARLARVIGLDEDAMSKALFGLHRVGWAPNLSPDRFEYPGDRPNLLAASSQARIGARMPSAPAAQQGQLL